MCPRDPVLASEGISNISWSWTFFCSVRERNLVGGKKPPNSHLSDKSCQWGVVTRAQQVTCSRRAAQHLAVSSVRAAAQSSAAERRWSSSRCVAASCRRDTSTSRPPPRRQESAYSRPCWLSWQRRRGPRGGAWRGPEATQKRLFYSLNIFTFRFFLSSFVRYILDPFQLFCRFLKVFFKL